MTTLFDSAHRVKPVRTFGLGLSTRPGRPQTHTLAELTQLFGEISDARDAALDAEYDARALESAALDCLERGLIPPDVAESLSRTSLVGHPA